MNPCASTSPTSSNHTPGRAIRSPSQLRRHGSITSVAMAQPTTERWLTHQRNSGSRRAPYPDHTRRDSQDHRHDSRDKRANPTPTTRPACPGAASPSRPSDTRKAGKVNSQRSSFILPAGAYQTLQVVEPHYGAAPCTTAQPQRRQPAVVSNLARSRGTAKAREDHA